MVAGGAMALVNNNVNAATKIDDTHVQVVSGDTLSEIANEYGVDVDTLAINNHIANKNLIHVGDKLVVTPTKNDTNNTVAQPTVNTNNSTATSNNTASQTTTNTASTTTAPATGDSSSAKEWIAQHESGGNYGATNGKYVGRYQLDASYLNGDYSPANQERVADQYVANRYGSWDQAKAHWLQAGWY